MLVSRYFPKKIESFFYFGKFYLLSNKIIIELFKVLELNGCESLSDISFKRVAKQLPKLTVLKLNWCFKVTESGLDSLALHCKKLSYISMRSTGLKALPFSLSRLIYLNHLDVTDCVSLMFPDRKVCSSFFYHIFKFYQI